MSKIRKQKKCAVIMAIAAIFEAENEDEKEERTIKKRKIWSKNYLLRRKQQGCYENLQQELALEGEEDYRQWMRMSTSDFEYLLSKVSPIIQKKNTVMREPIPAAAKLSVALRFLATGESQQSLRFTYRIAQSTISILLPEVLEAIYEVLKDDYLAVPDTEGKWKVVGEEFYRRWNFPMCICAMDGKHISICPPPGSGSSYYNYKGDFSVLLLALVDANTEFLYVDVGTNGRISDGGVWSKCKLKAALESGKMNIPNCGALPNTNTLVPYVIIADDTFPLCNYIMKPYPGQNLTMEQRIFNYRLSRARRVSENAFGILSARFRVFRSSINAKPENIKKNGLGNMRSTQFFETQ